MVFGNMKILQLQLILILMLAVHIQAGLEHLHLLMATHNKFMRDAEKQEKLKNVVNYQKIIMMQDRN